uniref:peptidylprolyl isomerase n=1 Tax=Serinus canaria TaxID=9135 RepID=A0A8C9NUK8_SERCA
AAEEVQIEVLHLPETCSPKSKKGDLLNAHYDGFLASDGSKFYCSRTQNEGHPKWFVLGVGQVIKGLDIAMMNMCPGEKRKVTIPPSLAYGQQGYALEGSSIFLQHTCPLSQRIPACWGRYLPNLELEKMHVAF